MANPDNTPTPDTLQEALLNDPEFLQRIVQNALQHILDEPPWVSWRLCSHAASLGMACA